MWGPSWAESSQASVSAPCIWAVWSSSCNMLPQGKRVIVYKSYNRLLSLRHSTAVVLALLAIFALRPGKGWLRSATQRTDAAPVYSSPKQTLVSMESGSLPDLSTGEPPLAPAPAPPEPALLSVQTAGEESGSLPLSYITTGVPTTSPATTRWVLGAAAAVGWPMVGTGQANAWVAWLPLVHGGWHALRLDA